MNPFVVVGVALLIFLGNLLYSAYSLKVLKEYSEKLSRYKSLKEENLKIRAEIERLLNLKELERYALKRGFRYFNWDEFVLYILREPPERDQPKRNGKR